MHPLQASRKRQESGRNNVDFLCNITYLSRGGGGGIRTRDTVSRIHTFQACAFDRSATPPARASIEKREGGAWRAGRAARASRAAVAFFTELAMELEGKGQIEGLFADRTVGLDGGPGARSR